MKKFVVALAVALSLGAFADSISLAKGLNTVAKRGKIAAIEAVTVDAAQSLKIQSIASVTEFTNAYKTAVIKRPRFDFTLTNWYGAASVRTNCLDRFDPRAWMPGGTNHIVGVINEVWVPVTNVVKVGSLPKATYTVTNDVWTGTASGHYKLDLPSSKFVTGGKLLVTCGDYDSVCVILE